MVKGRTNKSESKGKEEKKEKKVVFVDFQEKSARKASPRTASKKKKEEEMSKVAKSEVDTNKDNAKYQQRKKAATNGKSATAKGVAKRKEAHTDVAPKGPARLKPKKASVLKTRSLRSLIYKAKIPRANMEVLDTTKGLYITSLNRIVRLADYVRKAMGHKMLGTLHVKEAARRYQRQRKLFEPAIIKMKKSKKTEKKEGTEEGDKKTEGTTAE